jgi:branched-subunit amino acid transport protein
MRKLLVNLLQLAGLVSLTAMVISGVVAWDLHHSGQWDPNGPVMALTAVVCAPTGLMLWTIAQMMFKPAKAKG